ncbi:MAG: Mur ligase family protein [bacterium]|nr:Mur ligase family protein [bacterium]
MLQWDMSFNSSKKKIHFIGLCGAGMSAVAMLLKKLDWNVTGSDDNFYPPVSTLIEKSGIKFFKGYRKENIPVDTDVIVIGKHAGLTPKNNQEVKAAFRSKIPIMSFPELLGLIVKGKDNIVVAGSYGKSTCSALLAWCLEKTGQEPGYFIGAITHTPSESSNFGKGRLFILEGDEYPSSNWDKRSKFLHYHPKHLLLTSLAHDHLNVFKRITDYRRPFKKLIKLLPVNGTLTACADGDGVVETLKKMRIKATLYGSLKNGATWHIKNQRYEELSSFDIFRNDKKIVAVKTRLLGRHNLENILGVGAFVLENKLMAPKDFAQSVRTFKSPTRRLDKKSAKTTVSIYEGFGSSVDKARTAIETMKIHYPDRKLLVIFEPHALSWRLKSALPWYDEIFAISKNIMIYWPDKKPDSNTISLTDILERVKKYHDIRRFKSVVEGLALLKKHVNKTSVVLILTSGGFDGMIDKVVSVLENKYPKR